MEGVALEAIALAGHLQLDNLSLIYDNNQVTCDGPLDWISSEDVNSKMRACGWYVVDVEDGSYNVQAIVSALESSRKVTSQPVFISIHTVIGLGTPFAGTAKAHHGAFDAETVAESKRLAGQDPTKTHQVSDRALKYFRERKAAGEQLNSDWENLVARYQQAHPGLYKDFQARRHGELGDRVDRVLDSIDTASMSHLATRESSGMIMEKLWDACAALVGGGADLANSNKIYQPVQDVFLPWNYGGRYIRYGIREHAMASISNGIAAYGAHTFIPVTATFFMFYLYVSSFPRRCQNRQPVLLTITRPLRVSEWAR
jgi:dihydroxyacetone synthase